MPNSVMCRIHNIRYELPDNTKDGLYYGVHVTCPVCIALQLAEARKLLHQVTRHRDALAAAITVKLEIEATSFDSE